MHDIEDGISQLASTVLFLFAVAILLLVYNAGVDASQAARKAFEGGQQLTAVTEDSGFAETVEQNKDDYENYRYNNDIPEGKFYVEGKEVTRHVLKDANGKVTKIYYTCEPLEDQ